MTQEAAIDEALAASGPVRIRSMAAYDDATARLSPREREVTALVAHGRSNREIGAVLIIAARTADTHEARGAACGEEAAPTSTAAQATGENRLW